MLLTLSQKETRRSPNGLLFVLFLPKGLVKMARYVIVSTRCPLCGNSVERVPDNTLMKSPDLYDAELVVTRRGVKQYLHSTCWNAMIKEKRPYDGKFYM